MASSTAALAAGGRLAGWSSIAWVVRLLSELESSVGNVGEKRAVVGLGETESIATASGCGFGCGEGKRGDNRWGTTSAAREGTPMPGDGGENGIVGGMETSKEKPEGTINVNTRAGGAVGRAGIPARGTGTARGVEVDDAPGSRPRASAIVGKKKRSVRGLSCFDVGGNHMEGGNEGDNRGVGPLRALDRFVLVGSQREEDDRMEGGGNSGSNVVA